MTKALISSQNSVFLFDSNSKKFEKFIDFELKPDFPLLDFLCNDCLELKNYYTRWEPVCDYYGITWNKNKIYITCDQTPTKLLEINDKKLNNSFKPPSNSMQILRAHQIISIENEILVLSAENDALFKFNLEKQEWSIFYLPYANNFNLISRKSLYHPNSFIFHENELIVLCLLDTSLTKSNQKKTKIFRYEYPTMKLKKEEMLDTPAHHLWEMDGKEWYLDSGNRLIRSLSGEAIKITKNGWLRGIGVGEEKMIIGSSHKASERNQRRYKYGEIIVMDRNNYKTEFVEFPFGNINDIRLVNEFDFAHNNKDILYV